MTQESVSLAVLSGIRWTAGARILSQVATWAITLIVIRLLTPADYGLVAMASVFVGFAAMLSELGLGMSVVRSKTIDDETLQRLFGVIIAVQFALSFALIAAAPSIALFFSEPRVAPVIQVLSTQFMFTAFAVIPDATLQRQLRFRTRSLIELVTVVLGSVSTLVLAFAGMEVWSLVAGGMVAQAGRAAGLNICAPFLKRPVFSLRGIRAHASFGGQLTLTQILGFLFTQVDVFLIGRVLGKDDLGRYSVGVHLASMPNQRLSAIINQVAFPAFAHMQGDVAQLHRSLLLGVRVLALIGFPLFWGLSSVAPEFVAIVLGTKWQASALPLQLLSLIMPLRLLGNFLPNATQAIGRPDIYLKNYVFATVIMLPAFAIGVQFGLLGVCMAWVIGFPIVSAQSAVRNVNVLGLPARALFKAIAPAVTAAGLMYAIVCATRIVLEPALSLPVLLAAMVAVGAAAYGVAVWLLDKAACRETLSFAASIMGRRRQAGAGS